MQLREYQSRTIDLLCEWLQTYEGNPCICLPTGAGKSIIAAAICQFAINKVTTTRILLLTHVKELIEQDYRAMLRVWPEVDAGVYSAGLGLRELDHQVTFAGIASVYRIPEKLGKIDVCVVDECHLINAKSAGMYRTLLADLKKVNPDLRVIGLTATPYRLGHGMVTDKPAIFTAPLIEPVTIKKLQDMGFLSKLVSKATGTRFNLEHIDKVGGDYNRKQLEQAIDVPGKTHDVVRETIKRSEGRKSWLFFCSGVKHAINVRDMLRSAGVSAECITGEAPKQERERIVSDFKEGRFTALTNANVLTTGFDAPQIDLIVMMRPTLSPGLYLQMVGRGLRIAEGKKDCLVLDFVGNVLRHGPIHDVQPPNAPKHKGVAPAKICPKCLEIVAMSAMVCPVCGHEWLRKPPKEKSFQLNDADINATESKERIFDVRRWEWKKMNSRAGNPMICITYYLDGRNLMAPIREYLMCWADSEWLRHKSIVKMKDLAERAGVRSGNVIAVDEMASHVNCCGKCPKKIKAVKNDEGYYTVTEARWEDANGTVPVSG